MEKSGAEDQTAVTFQNSFPGTSLLGNILPSHAGVCHISIVAAGVFPEVTWIVVMLLGLLKNFTALVSSR